MSTEAKRLTVEEYESWKLPLGAGGFRCIADHISALEAEIAELKKNYHELLFAVSDKYHDETRHQTALRYIKQHYDGASSCDASKDSAMKEKE